MKLDGTRVCVAGLGVTGPSAVRALLAQGGQVVAVDGRDGDRERALADELRAAGAEVRLGDGDTLPDGVALVVTSPGWRPDAPLLAAAAALDVPIWGDVELAYRLRPTGWRRSSGRPATAPWRRATSASRSWTPCWPTRRTTS